MTRRLCSFVFSVSVCLFGAAANAQPPVPAPSTPPASPDFLTHYNFRLSAAALAIDDRRFTWDTHFGGDLDLVDYVVGRANVVIDYQAILGEELRKFDTNQGNYTLETSLSVRAGGTEVAAIFRHVSRHLGDRLKRFPIAWNVLGVRALRRFTSPSATVDVQGSAGRVVQHVFVDYSWTGNVDVVIRRPLHPRAGVYGRGLGEIVGIDAAESRRPTQKGGRLEGGLRLDGPAGAVELFAGFEQRIDADAFDDRPQRWAFVGFRFTNR